MKILGLVKTSTVDYPKKIVATIFLGYCNLSCEYCHNKELINPQESMTSIIEEELLKFLVSRKNILEGICITGGEATLNGIELINLVDKIREQMGENFSIKLDTNGTNPKFLEKYLEKFDYIAMDFKTLYYEKYLNCSEQNILESLNVLKNGKTPYEIRITMYPSYINEEAFVEIAETLKGVKKVFIQQYKVVEGASEKVYSRDVLEKFKKNLELKGISGEIR